MKTGSGHGIIIPGSFRAILSFSTKAHEWLTCMPEHGRGNRSARTTWSSPQTKKRVFRHAAENTLHTCGTEPCHARRT